ncbi:MAG: AraC family transcriptional regulator [Treponema sp.]|nr:AraC family transcriptional regulator [Treponema sp.]
MAPPPPAKYLKQLSEHSGGDPALKSEPRTRSFLKIDEDVVPFITYCIFRKSTPVWRIRESVFSFWSLTYITEGVVRYVIDGEPYDLAAGDLLCLPPGHLRSASTCPPNRLMRCFAAEFSLHSAVSGRISPRLPFALVNHIGIQDDIIHLFRELVYVWTDCQPLYSIKSRALLLLIIHRLMELIVIDTPIVFDDLRIEKVVNYITRHYAEKISVKRMAEMTGLNAVYFGDLFHRETGMTLNHYLTKTRIKNAENMLRSGNLGMEEIARHCGYNDAGHFYKHFKKVCGIAPSEYMPKKNKY